MPFLFGPWVSEGADLQMPPVARGGGFDFGSPCEVKGF